MKKYFKTAIAHPLIAGSMISFIGGIGTSFLNFLFNLLVFQKLSVIDSGIFSSLISVLSLAGVIAGAPAPMIIKFAGTYFAKEEYDKLRGFIAKLILYYVITGIILVSFFSIFPQIVGNFFHISDTRLIVLLGCIIFINFLNGVNGPILQAKLAFRFISITNFLSSGIKLALGFIFVFIGWNVFGVLWAFIVAAIFLLMSNFSPLFFLLKRKTVQVTIPLRELVAYGLPSAVAMFGMLSFITSDIILTKHFFSPHDAGLYAGLSLIGRVIFFFSAPISAVLFPLVVQKYARQENYQSTFLLASALIIAPSLLLTVFYVLFPDFTIMFFIRNKEYLTIAPLVGLFGLHISLYALLFLMTNFFLAIHRTKIFIPIIIAAGSQIGLIWMFHKTFLEVIFISLGCVITLLCYFVVYYIHLLRIQHYEKI